MTIDTRTLTSLLSFMADNHEVRVRTHTAIKPEFMRHYLLYKFPWLNETQVKHILRIL